MDGIQQSAIGISVISQPDEGASYWQPDPAGGYAFPKLTPRNTGFDGLSMGFQFIAPGCHIRNHSHDQAIELQIGFCGTGYAVVDGKTYPIKPGTACFIGYDVKHEIHNDTRDDLVMLWVIAPAGLEKYFIDIGRQRYSGEKAPQPFQRPEESEAIDRRVGLSAGSNSRSAGKSAELNRNQDVVGRVVVVPPGEGASYWQPKPADGYADNIFHMSNTNFDGLTMGYQTIPPGRYIREHAHNSEIELHICMSGSGIIEVKGEQYPLVPGTSCFVGYDVLHSIINDAEDNLTMMWVIAPAGLENHLAEIGLPRIPGEEPPRSFNRRKR